MSDYHSNLAAILWDAAEREADRQAIHERDQAVGFKGLRDRAAAFADALDARGVRPGDRVAIFLERSADAVAAIFGTYASGAIAVVVNERYRPRQIEHIVHHCEASLLVTTTPMLERQHRDLDIGVPLLDCDGVASAAAFTPVRRISPDVAQIIYTSGSTGMPKGVVFTCGALRAGITAVATYLGLRRDDRVATLLPFSSVYGINQVLTAVAVGASVVIERSPVPRDLVLALGSREVTVVAAVPPLWIQLVGVPDFEQGVLRSVRIAQNAGGHLPPEYVRRVRAALPHAELFLQYGMTETFRGTYLAPVDVDSHPGSMGRAMPDTEILLVDEHDRAVAPGEIGEVVHRGPTIALGYWKDAEATERTFRPNPLLPPGTPAAERVVYSGDMARRDPDGYLYYVGRRDRVIKTMGFRVGPDEVSDVLYASGQVEEAVVVAVPDTERGNRIVAHVVLRSDGSVDRLKRFCRTELPEYAQPADFVRLNQLPRLPSGKYDIDALLHGVDSAPE